MVVKLPWANKIERSQAEVPWGLISPLCLRSFCPPPEVSLRHTLKMVPWSLLHLTRGLCFFPLHPKAIHGKNLVSILHLLVSLAMHFRAPIHLPEHVTVQVVVVRVSRHRAISLPGSLWARQADFFSL